MPSNHLILCCPFSCYLPSFPATGSFLMSRLFIPGGQSIGASALVLPMNILGDWLAWSPCSIKDSQESSPAQQFKSINSLALSLLHSPTLTSIHETKSLTRRSLVRKVMSLLLNILSRLIITFLPRSKHLLISWLQSPSAVILEPPKNKVCHYFHCFPIYFPWSDGTRCYDLRFLNVEL